jgi:hypothetical protein
MNIITENASQNFSSIYSLKLGNINKKIFYKNEILLITFNTYKIKATYML